MYTQSVANNGDHGRMKFPKKHQNRQSFLKFNRQSFKFNKETNRIKSGKTRKKSLYFSSVKFFFCFIEEEMTGSNVSNSTPLYFHLTEIERTFTRISNVRIKQQVYVKANKKMLVHQAIQLGGETHKCFCIFFCIFFSKRKSTLQISIAEQNNGNSSVACGVRTDSPFQTSPSPALNDETRTTKTKNSIFKNYLFQSLTLYQNFFKTL